MSSEQKSVHEDVSSVSFASEITPIMGSSAKNSAKDTPSSNVNNTNTKSLLDRHHGTSLTAPEKEEETWKNGDYQDYHDTHHSHNHNGSSRSSTRSSMERMVVKTEMSRQKAISRYFQEHYRSVIIAFLLMVIFALAGDKASNQDQAANLVEDKISALQIQWRPCQMYLKESGSAVVGSGSGGSGSGTRMKVIQTSLGDPSTHWGELPCLVRNEGPLNFNNGDNSQWNWRFGSAEDEEEEATSMGGEPMEYGMPSADIKVDFANIAHPEREPIMGFGGAFTEAAALNYMTLSEEGREAVMSLLFGKDGLGYSLGRVHMNSCDFSVKSYNFDNIDGDFSLTNFDMKVEHDVKSGMIEMMLQANQKLKEDWKEGGINIMASPWSPPAWMKRPTSADPVGALHATGMTGSAEPNCLREGTGPDSRYAASWALYFSKFLDACKYCFVIFSRCMYFCCHLI